MNYQKTYDDLVKYCKNQVLHKSVYTEKHHIIPQSFGGGDGDNIIKVTARQHFVLHALLYFIAKRTGTIEERKKMAHAWNFMRAAPSNNSARYINSRLFEAAREDMSKRMSEAQSGAKNSQAGTMWITNGYSNKKLQKGKNIPEGYWKGRYSNGRKYDPGVPYGHERFNCVECSTEFFRKTNKSTAQRKSKCDACLDSKRTPLLYRKVEEFIELLDSGMSAHKACQTIGNRYKTKMASYGLSGHVTSQAKEVLQKANRSDLLERIK
jgi:hypothetical protein